MSNAIKFSPRGDFPLGHSYVFNTHSILSSYSTCCSGGAVTVYVYFDPEPLPLAHGSVAAQHTAQFSIEGQRDRAMRRGSFLDHFTGRGSNGGNVGVVRRHSLQNLVRVLSDRSPMPPMEGQQDGSVSPRTPAIATTLGKLVVVVADNGPGISAENQKRLFKEVRS